MKNRITIGIALSAALLLVPLLAMQITDDVAWGPADFALAGALLAGTGIGYGLATRKAATKAYRAAMGVALAAALLLIWMNLAVGLIGSEDNPANLLYVGVLALGLIGALIARLQPPGMARALFAMALAQALVPIVALAIWRPELASSEAVRGVLGVIGVNALFVLLFAGSALLFRRAARKQA